MKHRLILKIILVTMLIFLIIFSMKSYVEATNPNFEISGFDMEADSSIKTPMENSLGTLLNVVRTVGLGVAIIMLAFVAMKYMLAAPSERADLKKSSIQYVIGAVIVFGATNILTIIIEFVQAAVPE